MPSFADEILFGTLEGVERAIEFGADIEEIDEYGFSPLIEAVIANKVDVVTLLLEYGADINKPDTTGRSALHWAVDNHHIELCQLLLANHANPNAYTLAGQPILVYPLLRQQQGLKKLLYKYKAKLNFAQDFIEAKLLGHRYELTGYIDIVNTDGHFIEIDYEGFFLEFSLDVILHSLKRYKNHYSSRDLRIYFSHLQTVIEAFSTAQALLKYQCYTIDIAQHSNSIDRLLDQELLFLPIAYEGHAIGLIKYKNWLVRCDRGKNSYQEGSIVVYQLQNIYAWTTDLCKQLIFHRQSKNFFTKTIHRLLALKPIISLPMNSQIVGNCSWANMEASIPAILFILRFDLKQKSSAISVYQSYALSIYDAWHQWDKDRALEECIKSFYDKGGQARKISKATLLAAILFQRSEDFYNNLPVAESILKILTCSDYRYLLTSYLEVYWTLSHMPAGKFFLKLLDACGVNAREYMTD